MAKKLLAWFVACIFTFQLIPLSSVCKAKDIDNLNNSQANSENFTISSNNEESVDFRNINSKIVREIEEKREEKIKYFELNDNQILKAEYPFAVHLLDETGVFQDIYNNRNNSTVKFNQLSGNEKTITVLRDNAEFSWSYDNAKICSLEKIDDFHIRYKSIYEDVDLEYKFSPKNLKENLILNSSSAQKEFEITYNLNGLIAEQTDDKTIELLNENHKTVFKITAPEMFDNNNSHSDALNLKILSQGNDKLKIRLSCDKSWIESQERVYPITIDPDYTDESFEFTITTYGDSTPCTRYRKKDTNTSVFLDLRGSDFKGVGVVNVAIFGNGDKKTATNCTYQAKYYLLEAGKKYELLNSVNENGYDEVQIRFSGHLGQRIAGKWSPDYKPDPECLRIGGTSGTKGNSTDREFDYVLSPQGQCWTTIRTKANSSSVYLNLVDSGSTGIVRMSVWGIGGSAGQENCTNKQEFYDLSLGQKYELYNVVKEHNHSGVQLKFEGEPGKRILGKWSPDYSPEPGCVTVGSSAEVSDAVAIRPISYPQKFGSMEIDVKPISQFPEFPTGCESVSAVMVLHFHDHGVSVRDFINKFLIKKSLAEGPDPNSAFVGDPCGAGYGCFAPCIATAMNKVLSGARAEVILGKPLPYLAENFVKTGTPVLVWATIGMKKTSPGSTWTIGYVDENAQFKKGDRFVWPKHEHCVVLIGFDEKDYLVNDPYQTIGRVRGAYEKSLMEQRFTELGSQAVVVRKTVVPVPKQPAPVVKPADLTGEIVRKVLDFAKGASVQTVKNAAEPIFMVVGAFANSSEIQSMPGRVEAVKIGDQQVYIMGKITGDVLSTLVGIAQTAIGVSEIAGGIGGSVLGATTSSTGVGALVGVPVMVVSGTAVTTGAATATAGMSVVYSSIGNLGKDLGQLRTSSGGSCGRMTTPEATSVAKDLGYEKTSSTSHGQPVYYNSKTKTYITPDVDSHNGGVWKMAKTPEKLASKSTRMGTYDINLNRVGD